MRYFNTAGPNRSEDHYTVPTMKRLEESGVMRLIDQKAYFVIHAPRQVGKTTTMLALAKELTASGKYTSALVSLEAGAGFPDDVESAEKAILGNWQDSLPYDLPADLLPPPWRSVAAGQQIGSALTDWSKTSPRPIVLFLDEIDSLKNNVLISILRQLRSSYRLRPAGFPSSLAVIGLRDVRDYKIASGGQDRLSSPSPFNIIAKSILLRNFRVEEVRDLLGQHSAETGQPFTEEAINEIFRLTQGQPWLVNAVAKCCVEELEGDVTRPITFEHVAMAKERLILQRQTHLDQLADKLRDPRVRSVIEPILAGNLPIHPIPRDDIDYVIDLGLVKQEIGSDLQIANPIYQEVIPRELASTTQTFLPAIYPTWLNSDGSLNPHKLLDSFLTFWRQHGQPLLSSTPYAEIAPHLVMMAFMQRVVNGGGTLDREYAIGRDRIDLLVTYKGVRMAMELKIWRKAKNPIKGGLEQLDAYLSGLSLETGWLVIFDQRPESGEISERTSAESIVTPMGRTITLILA